MKATLTVTSRGVVTPRVEGLHRADEVSVRRVRGDPATSRGGGVGSGLRAGNRRIRGGPRRRGLGCTLVALGSAPGAAGKGRTLKKDYRVEVLEQKGGQSRVRDLFGNEGWVPAAAVK